MVWARAGAPKRWMAAHGMDGRGLRVDIHVLHTTWDSQKMVFLGDLYAKDGLVNLTHRKMRLNMYVPGHTRKLINFLRRYKFKR